MKPENSQPPSPSLGRKLAVVAAVVAFTTGLSGYFMGQHQTDRSAAHRRAGGVAGGESQISNLKSQIGGATGADSDSQISDLKSQIAGAGSAANAAAPAPAYAELRDRSRQPNHAWRSELAQLPPAPVFTATTARLNPEELTALIARRESRRAFTGAPPTVPHPIDQHSSTSCLACHGQPTRIGKIDVPQISHPAYTNCIQCHAPADGPGSALTAPPPALATPVLANSFVGQTAPSNGTRAFAGAPPSIPHPTALRQNFVSCHAPGGSSALKTSHPQRQNCLQCHALDATRDTQPTVK